MPIEFVCDHCQKLLKVGRRKIGCEVTCPKCGGSLQVPDEIAACVSLALRQEARSPQRDQPVREFFVYDDPPPSSAGRGSASGAATAAALATSNAGGSPPRSYDTPRGIAVGAPRSVRGTAATRAPSGSMLLVSRQTLYIQAGLFAFLGAAAFLAGYMIGRGREPLPLANSGNQPAAQHVEGVISYKTAAGVTLRDTGAAVLAIPEGKYPARKWDATGLHPRQPAPADDARVLLEIEELGGFYARADAEGNYLLSVPRSGRYSLLFISRNARRASGADIDPDDLEELRQLFSPPVGDLIGRSKYAFETVELAGGQIVSHSHDFGVDGQK